MTLNVLEESTAWAISKAEPSDIVKDAIRKEQVLKYGALISPLANPVQKRALTPSVEISPPHRAISKVGHTLNRSNMNSFDFPR